MEFIFQIYNGIAENLNSCDLETYMQLSNNGSGFLYVYYTDFQIIQKLSLVV